MTSQLYGIIAAKITIRVGTFVEQHNLGYVAIAVNHQTDDGSTFTPAVAFYAAPSAPMIETGGVSQMPELAVEMKFPDLFIRELRIKAGWYLNRGCQIVWLVFPEKRIIEVHSLEGGSVFTDEDILDGGNILPGFSVAISELFPPRA